MIRDTVHIGSVLIFFSPLQLDPWTEMISTRLQCACRLTGKYEQQLINQSNIMLEIHFVILSLASADLIFFIIIRVFAPYVFLCVKIFFGKRYGNETSALDWFIDRFLFYAVLVSGSRICLLNGGSPCLLPASLAAAQT